MNDDHVKNLYGWVGTILFLGLVVCMLGWMESCRITSLDLRVRKLEQPIAVPMSEASEKGEPTP